MLAVRTQQLATRSDLIGRLSHQGTEQLSSQLRSHRSQRAVFAACNNVKDQFHITNLPTHLKRFPSMIPRPQQKLCQTPHFTPTEEDLLYGPLVGHSPGDIATVYARPLPDHVQSTYMKTLRDTGAHMLVVGGLGGMVAVALCNGLTTSEHFFSTTMASNMIGNLPVAGLCAISGDAVAQMLSGKGIQQLNMRRAISAGLIGSVLQGFLTTGWIWNLNLAIPRSMIGIDSLSQVGWLAIKVGMDSALWGSVMNTINVVARRIAAGDSVVQAYHNWREIILGITRDEFKFWPAFGAMVYTCVPEAQQVNAFGVGGFIWSVYLSCAANTGVTSNAKGLFRYGKPTGVRMSNVLNVEQNQVVGRLLTMRFDDRSSALPLHGAIGRLRASCPCSSNFRV